MTTDKNEKKVRQAAALEYDSERNNAPIVTAVGKGPMAERMVKEAEEHGVPVVKDEGLAGALNRMGVGDEIPRELYEIVAQILVFVSNLDKEYSK
jgi:flagellar biosynthesis protein